ncbi:putative ferric reductase NAD binding domain [Lyophyllum shimeji]|uniref:ferric-chelate reductase (NADPH) n=1 Tax=Lyophyllum shimeji TaxID=47721 RepID=A0A9P3Q0Y2_LYOSH|nr:putative ferric reductase NAD binding domain [Lyophyllum shimeji]
MASRVPNDPPVFTPDHVAAAAKASQTPDPDRAIRIAQARNYPNRAWFCVAAFIAIVSACHFLTLLHRMARRKRPHPGSSRGAVSLYRLPKATVNAFRAVAFRYTIPVGNSYTLNVAEVFLTAAYTTLVFVWSLVNTTSKKGVKYDPKYWANIAGNLAALQLPLMTALGTKNNILSFLTGVSFDKLQLNYLHRMSARVLCVLLWVHAAGRIKIGMVGSTSWTHPWIQSGLLASTAFTILCLVSIRPLRERGYEIFLAVHFLMAFITILAGYFHARENHYGHYVWPSFVIWGLDRVIRMLRILIYNAGYLRKSSVEELGRVEALSPHFVRITLQRPAYMHWRPGQSAYLMVPGVSASPFEAHPFTISSIDVPSEVHDTSAKEDASRKSSSSRSEDDIVVTKQLTFLIRVRSGFTKRLLAAAAKDQAMRVILDGPYSSPPLLRGYETVVLIAGGSGVAFTLPLLLDLIHRAKRDDAICTRVVFVWAIRDASHIDWIAEALVPAIAVAPPEISISIRVHVTGVKDDAQSWDDDSAEGDEEVKVGKESSRAKGHQYPGISMEQGRPDLKRLLDDEIHQASGDMSVNVCGTHALANAVKSALRRPRFFDVLRGGPTVTLHVESFGNT